MKKAIVFICIIALAGISVFLFIRAHQTNDVWFGSKPNYAIRKSVAGIQANDIAAIKLDILPDTLILTSDDIVPKGLNLQPGFRYEKRKNPKAIIMLLAGLKEATSPPYYHLDRICIVQLILKNGKTIGQFNFGNHRFADCISPQFIEGLKLAGVKSLPHK